jgi:dTDP-4-dehydrorhamnose reductase
MTAAPSAARLRLAVIGRSGQLAQALAEAAAGDATLDLAGLGRPDLDLTQPATIRPALQAASPTLVINTAAHTAVDRAESEPDAAFALNRDGAAALARACADLHLPLIHISTDYVFGGPSPGRACREDDPVAPRGVYARSKCEGEQAVLAAHPGAVILRTAWLHAPFGGNFVRTMLRLMGERDELRVVADQHGSPTYAPDLAAALIVMARRLGAAPQDPALHGVFHLAGSGHGSWYEVAQATVADAVALGRRAVPVHPITTADYPTPAPRPAWSVLDTAKIARHYGLGLPLWRDGVRRCVGRLLAP